MTTHLTAKELLELGDENREKPFLKKVWPQTLGVIFGICSGVIINFGTRRPVFSGLQKHAAGVIVWTAGLMLVDHKRNEYLIEKDAVLRHYIEIHSEDFPDPERQKIGNIIEPWIPVR